MATNVTKILFRRGTEAQRRTITFNASEPAYCTDSNRLYIGDGSTVGGLPLTVRNYGFVAALVGSYLGSGLDQTAYNLLTAGQVGDIVYDRTTSNIWTLTSSTFGVPNLSNLAQYPVISDINSSQFTYTGTQLNLASNSIKTSQLDSSVVGVGLSGGSGSPVSIKQGGVTNDLLHQMASNSVKVNNTNSNAGTPIDLQIKSGQVLGRGTDVLTSVTLSGTRAITVSSLDKNTITIDSVIPLPLAGGTMGGAIDATSYGVYVSNPTDTRHAVSSGWVANLPCYGTFDQSLQYSNSTFMPLTGGLFKGALSGSGGDLYIDSTRVTITPPGMARRQGPSGWGKGITTFDVYADSGTVGVGTLGSLSAYMNKYGNAYFKGNVGIGDTASGNLTDLWINNANYASVQLGNNDDTGFTITRETTDNTFNIWRGKWGTPKSRSVIIDQQNQVGINTGGNPLAQLHVNGDLRLQGASAQPVGYEDPVNLKNTYITFLQNDSKNDWCHLRQIGTDNNFILSFDLHDDGNSSTLGQQFAIRNVTSATNPVGGTDTIATRFQIDGNGNVGINTPTPNYQLDVQGGDIYTSGSLRGGTNWNLQTANYNIADSDVGGTVAINSSANLIVTVPNNTFRAGYQVTIVRLGTGGVTIAGGTGVNIRQAYSQYKLNAQYSAATLVYSGNSTTGWILFGDLTT
jgi:Major tropism determinant N-terminal domain